MSVRLLIDLLNEHIARCRESSFIIPIQSREDAQLAMSLIPVEILKSFSNLLDSI